MAFGLSLSNVFKSNIVRDIDEPAPQLLRAGIEYNGQFSGQFVTEMTTAIEGYRILNSVYESHDESYSGGVEVLFLDFFIPTLRLLFH